MAVAEEKLLGTIEFAVGEAVGEVVAAGVGAAGGPVVVAARTS